MVKRGTYLKAYSHDTTSGRVILELACGHSVDATPATATDHEILSKMLTAHNAGVRMYTDCEQCAALPALETGLIH